MTDHSISLLTLFAVIITALSTIIYTVGTFLLWRTTQKSTALVKMQLDNQQKQLQSAAYSQVLASHREIFLSIVKDDKLLEAVFGKPTSKESPILRKKWMGTVLINHCSMMFNEYTRGALNRDTFENFIEDAKYLFSFPAVSDRWEEVFKFHGNEFVEFVDTRVLSRKISRISVVSKDII